MSFRLERAPWPAPGGPLTRARVPWDSETFGLGVFDLEADPERADEVAGALPGLLRELERERPHLAAVKIPVAATALSRALSEAGFYAVETMLELHLPLERMQRVAPRVPAGLALREARAEDLPALEAMARGAFHADRFHLDPNLDPARAGERYARWVARGFAAGEPVFVYEDARRGRTIGFFHVRPTAPGTCDLSLAAVEPGARRLGLGSLMYQAVVEACRERGFRAAETHVTVQNLDVLNLFARLGFAFRAPVLCLHRFAPASA